MNSRDLKYQYNRLNIAEKIIAINVLVFIINGLFTFLLKLPSDAITRWMELPINIFSFIKQPWSIITYSFFHGSIGHIFWNMLLLYFSSRILLNLFGEKRFINVYFLGVIAGGLLFLLSYNIFPVFSNINAALIGASAGVTAVLIFICTYIPNKEVRVFVFNVKLWHIGAFFVLVDLVQISDSGNPGGHISHLGGALLGYVYARQVTKGNDIGEWFSNFISSIASIFKKGEKKSPLKTVYKNKTTSKKAKVNNTDNHQRKIDIILDKISKSGYESLSKEEKDFLFKAGK